jgi:hypothetical protein
VSGSGTIRIREVWRILEECAPGYEKYPYGDHKWEVRYKGFRYPHLPLGAHGRKRLVDRAEIELGHVKSMCRLFGIMDCARAALERLGQ